MAKKEPSRHLGGTLRTWGISPNLWILQAKSSGNCVARLLCPERFFKVQFGDSLWDSSKADLRVPTRSLVICIIFVHNQVKLIETGLRQSIVWLSLRKPRTIMGRERLCFHRVCNTWLWLLNCRSVTCLQILVFTCKLDWISNLSSVLKYLAITVWINASFLWRPLPTPTPTPYHHCAAHFSACSPRAGAGG